MMQSLIFIGTLAFIRREMGSQRLWSRGWRDWGGQALARLLQRLMFSMGTQRSSTGGWQSLRVMPKRRKGEFPGGYKGVGEGRDLMENSLEIIKKRDHSFPIRNMWQEDWTTNLPPFTKVGFRKKSQVEAFRSNLMKVKYFIKYFHKVGEALWNGRK